jgi:mRNA interferase MazF
VNRGEVWWAEHPETGRRPYLILTRSAALPGLYKVAAVPATRRIRSIPSEAPGGGHGVLTGGA